MKKKSLQIGILLPFILLLASCSNITLAFESREDVPVDYEWSIEFSKAVSIESARDNISIIGGVGKKVSLSYRLDGFGRTIKIKPQGELEYEQTYTILVSEDMESLDGEKLQQSATLEFITESKDLQILDLLTDRDTYYLGDQLSLDISIKNNRAYGQEFWIGCSLRDPVGNWMDIEPIKATIDLKETSNFTLQKEVGEWLAGEYEVNLSIWSDNPSLVDTKPRRLDQLKLLKPIYIYRGIDHFESWNQDFWIKRDGVIGQTRLNPENILLDESGLRIRLPENRLEGGEIQTRRNQSFGSYEVSMKLPNAPSSITGFFLYRPPDFYHEIDIEVFNQPDSQLWLTTYENGKEVNEYKEALCFDPTSDYHRYRIDYYPDRVSFYIDGKHIQTWEQGFSKRPMRLMLNSWYPTWLDGTPSQRDEYLDIEWIRY